MSTAAHRRHLLRAQARLVALVGEAARELPAELLRRPVSDAALRQLRMDVSDAISRFHPAYVAGFNAGLDRGIRDSLPANTPRTFDIDSLEIMDDQRVQEEVEVVQAGQLLTDEAAGPLHRLLRLESLLRAEPLRRTTPSPVGPSAIGRALWRATERLPLTLAGRSETVRATVRLIAPGLAALYDTLVTDAETDEGISLAEEAARAAAAAAPAQDDGQAAARAVAAGMAPPVRPVSPAAGEEVAAGGVAGAPRAPARPAFHQTAPADDDSDSGFDVTRPDALLALLQRGMQRGTSGEGGGAFVSSKAHATTQPMPMEGDDARVPDVIHRHRDALASVAAGNADAAPALITRIFDEIVADPTLPPDASGWLGRLQPAVVALSRRDPELLRTHRHPAWTFINRLAMMLCEEPGARPPNLTVWMQKVTTNLLAEPTPERFESANRQIAQWRREQALRRLTEVETALDLLRRHAALEPQVTAGRPRLQRRLDAAGADAIVRRFVLSVWALVCAQQDASEERAPHEADAWDTALDLIWSTSAARSRNDAPILVPMIPALVEQLRAGMARLGLGTEGRDAWLERLAPLHVRALQRTPEEAATDEPITMDLTLEDMMPADGMVAPAPETALAGEDDGSDLVIELGDRVTMQVDGEWVELQLVWASDNGHFLLLAGADGRSRSVTRASLARLLREGLVRTSDTATVLARATRRLSRDPE